jgi:hypothetical protein
MAALENQVIADPADNPFPARPAQPGWAAPSEYWAASAEPWATSNQNAVRHQIGIGGRLRQNPQRDATGAGGLHERYPGSVYQSHPDAVRHGLAI